MITITEKIKQLAKKHSSDEGSFDQDMKEVEKLLGRELNEREKDTFLNKIREEIRKNKWEEVNTSSFFA